MKQLDGFFRLSQRGKIFGNVLGGLLQVQPHIGDLGIPGQPEFGHGLADPLLGFLFHVYHLGPLYPAFREKSTFVNIRICCKDMLDNVNKH